MDFSNYKFVVSTGCSYGRLADYALRWFEYTHNSPNLINEYGQTEWLDLDDSKIISINLSLSSQGSDWQSDSIIHVVNELLKLEVKSENIFCLVEWSQWFRFAIHPPHHYGLDFDKMNFVKDEYEISLFNFRMFQKNTVLYEEETRPILSYLHDYFNLFKSRACESCGKIGDRIYMMPRNLGPNVYGKLGLEYELFYEDILKVENDIPLETKINVYLNNILRTQFFLEKNNLKYNFVFMQSTLSDWKLKDNGIIYHPLFNGGVKPYEDFGRVIKPSPKFNPANNPKSDIENIMPELKSKINQINFDNFWFHETERFRRGGIDEWAIDKLKETGFVELPVDYSNPSFDPHQILPNYNNHPYMAAYILLWNKVAFNCDFVKVKPDFEKFIWDKYWEDYNYDGISKNRITISKKEWDRIVIKNNLF